MLSQQMIWWSVIFLLFPVFFPFPTEIMFNLSSWVSRYCTGQQAHVANTSVTSLPSYLVSVNLLLHEAHKVSSVTTQRGFCDVIRCCCTYMKPINNSNTMHAGYNVAILGVNCCAKISI